MLVVTASAFVAMSPADAIAATVTATPNTDLVTLQTVTVQGAGFPGTAPINVAECAETPESTGGYPMSTFCNTTTTATSDSTGQFTTPLTVSRLAADGRNGTVDCLVRTCYVVAWSGDHDAEPPHLGVSAFTPLAFRAPSVTVTPSHVFDGETVTVTGTAWEPRAGARIGQCAGQPTATAGNCDLATVVDVPVDTSGSFTVPFVVRQMFAAADGTFDCVAVSCSVFAIQFTTFTALPQLASVTLTFGPPPPRRISDCFNGGWRHLAGTNGQPFKNQGQCVSFAAHLPRS